MWLALQIGTGIPTPVEEGEHEWIVFLAVHPFKGDWVNLVLDLPQSVEATYGRQGWCYDQLLAIRVRGHLTLARIDFLSNHITRPDQLEHRPRKYIEVIMKAEQGIVGWDFDGDGYESKEFNIEFDTKFKSTPILHTSFELIDFGNPNPEDLMNRLGISVESIDKKQAMIKIYTWNGGLIWGCKINWLAIGN